MSELAPTPTQDSLPRRFSDFATLGAALDYAALGKRGLNFHDMRGQLSRPYAYSEMREDALKIAYRLISHGIRKDDRVALVAETGPDFAALFFGCVYAGAWPVPLPLPTSFGGKGSYVDQLSVQLKSCDPKILFFPAELADMANDAACACDVEGIDWESFSDLIALKSVLPESHTDEVCYLQYSSGSTRFPHGVAVTHKALLNNLSAHSHGMEVTENDRCVSWLPWYHDMGLVGCFLSPVANQVSTDYMKTEDFARRPLAWLDVISAADGTVISYSPTFGYDICARRISSQSNVNERFDLSKWRLAGNGADMIRPDVMQAFVDAFGDAGYRRRARCDAGGEHDLIIVAGIEHGSIDAAIQLLRDTQFLQVHAEITQRLVKFFLARNAFGQIELTTDFSCRIKKRHLVPTFGSGDGEGESSGAGTDHGDLLHMPCWCDRQLGLVTCARIDKTTGELTIENVIEAGLIAADAGVDLVAALGGGLVDELRVSQEGTRHGHHVGIASREHLFGHLRGVNAIGSDDRHW